MHEMSITLSMIDIVNDEMRKRGVERLERLKIRVGKLTAVEPQSLLFCFDVCTRDTPLEGARLDIEEVPISGTCMDCNEEFHMEGFLSLCPRCEGGRIEKISGNELDIVSMEVV
jgi:hydrogenase nickel incorporation protein HypA/HybF